MGAANTTTGRMFYPINVGKKDTDVTSDYDDKRNEFVSGDAFSDVSVNPQFKATQIGYENSTTGLSWVDSANFIEIRNAPYSGGVSNDDASLIVNRIYPTNTSLSTYAKNRDETNSYKIKVYDSNSNDTSVNNSKFKYNTSNYPSGGVIGLDIDNYDYFILINPDLTGNKDSHSTSLVSTLDTESRNNIRPHFARITRITSFDEFGDGLEFEPKYPTAVPINSNFEIYKGTAKTDTSVVAVSYGLRGDSDLATDKYDVTVRAIRPLFYFYNDRLDEDNQLDFCEKYNVTSERWWAYGTELNVNIYSAHTQYANTTSQTFHLTNGNTDLDKLIEGQSIFDSDDNYIGNIKEKTGTAGQFKIDYSRISLSSFIAGSNTVLSIASTSQSGSLTGGTGTNTYSSTGGDGNGATFNITVAYDSGLGVYSFTSIAIANGGTGYSSGNALSVAVHGATFTVNVGTVGTSGEKIKIGKTIQNVVFRTESKFSNTIPSLGRSKILATLVDAHKTTDSNTSNSSFDATKWDSAFVKMKRQANDLLTPTTNSIDGGLTGPTRYITFEKAEYKNNKIEPIQSKSLNSPKNKLTKMAHITLMDNSGLQHLKVREGDVLKLRNNLFNGKFTKKKIEGYLNKTSYNALTLYNIPTDIDLHHILSTNDIIEVGDYHFVVHSITNKSSDNAQTITIKDYKLTSASSWVGSGNLNTPDPDIEILGKTMFVMPYSGVLNFEFESDTVAKITTGGVFQTLTMDNVAVQRTDSRMHLSTMTPLRYNSHVLEIDYADKNNKYAKLKNPNKTLYQKSTVSADIPYYYNGSYSITDEVFCGEVEDIDIKTESGFTSFKISGRDDSSKLLGDTISKTLTQFSDVIKTSLPPLLTVSPITNVDNLTISGKTITIELDDENPVPSDSFAKYSLLFNHTNDLIGEVASSSYNGGGGDHVWTITLTDQALTTSENDTLKTYNPYGSNQINSITGTKALQSNPTDSVGFGDFTSISEKGLSFKSGLDIGYTTGFDYTTLQLSSNDDSTKTGNTLGYDISAPKSISTEDSIFAFTIGNENGVDITKSDIMSVNSEMFDVVRITEQHSASTVLEIAPLFPMVLGRVEINSLDDRGNTNLYLVNNNIESGGFIHRLNNNFEVGGNITPSETIRYWDLQTINEGGLTRTHDSIYNVGKKPQAIQGYAVGYGVKADGTLTTLSATSTSKPKLGSNTLDGWTHLSSYYHATAPLPRTAPLDLVYWNVPNNKPYEIDILYSAFEQIDPRTLPYELLATGDIYPSSKLRHNSMFAHSKPYSTFGIIYESEASKSTNKTSHQSYDGVTAQSLKRDINFETGVIKGSGKNTAEMKRWGIIRLVEATFDWHFNPIDFESLRSSNEIPAVPYFDYHMITRPSIVNLTDSQLDSDDTDGDMYYKLSLLNSGYASSEETADGDFILESNEYGGLAAVSAKEGFSKNNLSITSSNDTLKFSGYTWPYGDSSNGHPFFGVETFRLFSAPDYSLEGLTTRDADLDGASAPDSYFVDRQNNYRNIRFHTAWLMRPNITTDSFSHQMLREDTDYDPMNIILPIIAENKDPSQKGSNHDRDMRYSPFHSIDGWDDDNTTALNTDSYRKLLHMSRVISAMIAKSYGSGHTKTPTDYNSLGVGRTHVYDNCIGLFKDWIPSTDNLSNVGLDISLSSAPLSLATESTFTNFSQRSFGGATIYGITGQEQHTQTSRLWKFTNVDTGRYLLNGSYTPVSNNYQASLLGTKSKLYPLTKLSSRKFNDALAYRKTTHELTAITSTSNNNTGMMFCPQMIIKPTFNLTAKPISVYSDGVVYSNNNKTITFTLGDNLTHSNKPHTWLSFMPDLTGYYIVSEELVDGSTLKSARHHGVPKFMAKITNHNVTAPSLTGTLSWEKHELTFDTAIDTSNNGAKYRLMKIAERTFDETPNKIEFNVMNDTGIKYNTFADNFRSGKSSSEDASSANENKYYQEGVYSMYLRLDIDSTVVVDNPFIECRTTTSAIRNNIGLFSEGDIITTHVTDGNNKQQVDFTVSLTRPKKTSKATEPCLVLTYDGKLTGNGVVSCGEIFDVTIGKKPKLQNVKRCYIGTTYDIGSNIDTELANIVKSAGLEYDETKSTSVFTTNIVNSNGTNTVVCLESVVGLNNGDVIYTQEGHLIGKILSINNQTITFASGGKYYSPPQYSAIIKYNKKTFVTNLTFNNTDLYGAINSLTNKKGLDYKIKGKKIIFRDSDDMTGLRVKEIKFEHLAGHEPIQNNTSLFDKISVVVVNGDGVSHTMVSNKVRNMKTLTVNDSTIKTQEEAMIEASKKLQLHSGEARKITLQINKEGFELLEAGDIVVLDFPTYNIPYGEYVIFEIENVLGMILTMTVGTYSKGIAERLSEITEASRNDTSHLLTVDSVSATSSNSIFDNLKLRVSSIEYKVVGETLNANMGFDDVFGFSETVGFETTSTGISAIKKEYKNRFYD